jgi:hypothetical protein
MAPPYALCASLASGVGDEPLDQCGRTADVEAMLLALATTARTFLMPHWHRWHEQWGPPPPAMVSQWTCVRSSLFLVRVLEGHGIAAVLRSGQPRNRNTGGIDACYGRFVAGCWVSHAWVEANGFIVDVTADQFGAAPVIVTETGDAAYRAADDDAYLLPPTLAAHAAAEDIWPIWCHYVNQQGLNDGLPDPLR